eukprot:jgi/Mesvir1/11308/Mv01090-RA.2
MRRRGRRSFDSIGVDDLPGGLGNGRLGSMYEAHDGSAVAHAPSHDIVMDVKLNGASGMLASPQSHPSARLQAALLPTPPRPARSCNKQVGIVKLVRLLDHQAAHAEEEAFERLRVTVRLSVHSERGSRKNNMPQEKQALTMRWTSHPSLSRVPPMGPPGSLACMDVQGARAGGVLAQGPTNAVVDPALLASVNQRQVSVLSALGTWEFDTLALAEASPRDVVQLVGFTLFVKGGLVSEFSINELKLANFLEQIARGMQPHPYHNAVHISDVSASLFHLLMESGVGDHLRRIDWLAAVCAALVHDYKHPGVNNDFLNRTKEELAIIYNDNSPLENYHLAEAFHLLYSNEHCNFLEVLSESDYNEVRRVIIDLVLASDLKRHFGILDQFKARVSQGMHWDTNKETDRLLLLQMALKVADLGHSAKPLAVHQEWSRRVTEEFYKQGDAERGAELDVSPFMDRFNNNVPRSQVSG